MVTTYHARDLAALAAKRVLLLLFVLIAPHLTQAQLQSGERYEGEISNRDEVDTWSFTASIGERIVLRSSQLNNPADFALRMEVKNPSGQTLNPYFIGGINDVEFTATNNGTFTVQLSNLQESGNGTGSYRLNFIKLPGPFSIPAGDDGGLLPVSGGIQDGEISYLGDLDLWTFPVLAGDQILFRWAKLSDTNALFGVEMRLYDPQGTALKADATLTANEYSFVAPTNGNYKILVSARNGTVLSGTGPYRIHLVRMPEIFIVPPNDDGGLLVDGVTLFGTVNHGDLDLWAFNARAGNNIILQVTNDFGGADFSPEMRLYAPNGNPLVYAAGTTSAGINHLTTTNGMYYLVVSDAGPYLNNPGGYLITGRGISSGPVLFPPFHVPAGIVINAAGGPPNQPAVLYASTNINAPLSQWTPIFTNQLDRLGAFYHTNQINPGDSQKFFRLSYTTNSIAP